VLLTHRAASWSGRRAAAGCGETGESGKAGGELEWRMRKKQERRRREKRKGAKGWSVRCLAARWRGAQVGSVRLLPRDARSSLLRTRPAAQRSSLSCFSWCLRTPAREPCPFLSSSLLLLHLHLRILLSDNLLISSCWRRERANGGARDWASGRGWEREGRSTKESRERCEPRLCAGCEIWGPRKGNATRESE
jgi:hypothetical protein